MRAGSGMKKCWMPAALLQEKSPDIMITRKPLRVLIPLPERNLKVSGLRRSNVHGRIHFGCLLAWQGCQTQNPFFFVHFPSLHNIYSRKLTIQTKFCLNIKYTQVSETEFKIVLCCSCRFISNALSIFRFIRSTA